MPPKKKEQQIDLSSLPECKSINVHLLSLGKKARANAILERLQKQAEKFMFRVRKSEVLDHAKEKNIYIDPNTLTDKQKKDQKFMQSINTELTPPVIAKAVQSHLGTLTVKARIEKKNNPQFFANQTRRYDIIYVFEDFPESKEQFQELAKIGEGVKYLLVVEPKISWANAPQLPEENENQDEEDEQIKQYKSLLKKEQKNEEDIEFQNGVSQKIASLRKMRSQSASTSPFRNCTVSVLEPEIDPYNEENSLSELSKAFFDNINKLDSDYVEFDDWKKSKQAEPMPQQLHQPQPKSFATKGTSLVSMLENLARSIGSSQVKPASTNEDEKVLELIVNFTAGKKRKAKSKEAVAIKQTLKFVGANEEIGDDQKLRSELRSQLRYPGINRFQIPEIPPKSQGIRKLELANYALFLKDSMSIDQFLRRQRISNFQEFIREFDEQRSYSFANRVYQQQHNVDSLRRELYRASEAGEASTFSKYDENSDKLYLMFVYRNNGRRVSKKVWQSSWKVLPNYEYWLKYFKNNDGNLSNNQFYDLDYEKIGNIEEVSRAYTLKNGTDGAVIVDKECSAGNTTQKLLYSIKQQLIFGVHHHQFYSQFQNVKIFHHRNADTEGQEFETVILLPEGRVRISSSGNLLLEFDGQQRMVTPEGYTIIYEKDRSVILHPNGGISYSKDTYVNERGYGLKDGHLHTTLALQRTAANGKILKREDDTVIVHKGGENPSKWVKFYEGTEYQVVGDQVNIEKIGRPFVCCRRGEITVITKELELKVVPRGNFFSSSISLSNGAELTMNLSQVKVSQKEDEQVIIVCVDTEEILSNFGQGEQIRVGIDSATYKRKDRSVDAREDEERYGEDQTLPTDYIEPRLFIINNDNTGLQLLNEKMVDGYLKQVGNQIKKIYKQRVEDKEETYIVSKVDQIQPKCIKNDLIIQLDVFDNSKEQPKTAKLQNLAIRTLIKYPSLTPNDMAQVSKIKAEMENWKKANLREENEFGHKPKNSQALKQKIDSKLLTLKMRQRSDPLIDSQVLKEKGKASYLATIGEESRQIQAKRKEAEMRKRYLTKRDSVIRDYKPINLSGRRKEQREEQVQQVGTFLDHYFLTSEGKKALSEMPEWVFRPKEIKQPAQLDAQIQNQLNNTRNLNREDENSEEVRERYDTVEVNLNPRPDKQIIIKPSVFTQREIDEERVAFESEKKAYKYHEVKRKDFNVYGEERRSRPEVRGLLRTQAISEINQKYLVTQAPLDKRIKISSMRNKLTSSASSIVEMRKEGPHSLLMKTLDKGNDVNKLLEKRTMMVQADLNDKLQRDILINPVEANFGVVLERKTYELKIDIKNQDIIPQRITLKRPKSIYAKATLSEMGPIAMGMTRKITVTFKASPEMLGKFTDEFDIVTKHEIYHIPIIAHIISENQLKNETLGLSAGVIEVQQGLRKKGEGSIELPRLK